MSRNDNTVSGGRAPSKHLAVLPDASVPGPLQTPKGPCAQTDILWP